MATWAAAYGQHGGIGGWPGGNDGEAGGNHRRPAGCSGDVGDRIGAEATAT